MSLNPFFFQFRLWFILMSAVLSFVIKNTQEHTTFSHCCRAVILFAILPQPLYIYCLVTVLKLGNVSLVLFWSRLHRPELLSLLADVASCIYNINRVLLVDCWTVWVPCRCFTSNPRLFISSNWLLGSSSYLWAWVSSNWWSLSDETRNIFMELKQSSCCDSTTRITMSWIIIILLSPLPGMFYTLAAFAEHLCFPDKTCIIFAFVGLFVSL